MVVTRGYKERGTGMEHLLSPEFPAEQMEKFWRLRAQMAAQRCRSASRHRAARLKLREMEHLMLCVFYDNIFKCENIVFIPTEMRAFGVTAAREACFVKPSTYRRWKRCSHREWELWSGWALRGAPLSPLFQMQSPASSRARHRAGV